MNEDEQLRLIQEVSQYGQQQANPAYIIPFILYNLEVDERQYFSNLIPSAVVRELIPITWKNSWSPMAPFLLK